MSKDFKYRDYQKYLSSTLLNSKENITLAVWPRRSGKTLFSVKFMAEFAYHNKGQCYYFSHSHNYIKCFLIPLFKEEFKNNNTKYEFDNIKNEFTIKNSLETHESGTHECGTMTSKIKILVTDRIDMILESDPACVIIDELLYRSEDIEINKKLRSLYPIILKRKATLLIIGTPQSNKSILYDIFNEFKRKNYNIWLLNCTDTKHILEDQLCELKEIASEELFSNEFYPKTKMLN